MSNLPLHHPRQLSTSDFLFGNTLGEGRFGTVVYAELIKHGAARNNIGVGQKHECAHYNNETSVKQNHQTQRPGYAIKMIPKSEIFRRNQTQAVLTEKCILSELLANRRQNATTSTAKSEKNEGQELSCNNSPSALIVKLYSCFHDVNNLYFVLELCAGGTLLDLINDYRASSVDKQQGNESIMELSWVRYYAGQVLRALEYLHNHGVVHRDISCRNIGLTFPNGHVRLLDFGSAIAFVKSYHDGEIQYSKWEPSSKGKSTPENIDDFVGTADYVSPEMIRGRSDKSMNDSQGAQGHQVIFLDHAMDLWSYGCLIFHMIVGESPFHASSDHLAFQNIMNYANGDNDLRFPPFVCDELKILIASLLAKDPRNRLGVLDDMMPNSNHDAIPQRQPFKKYNSIRNHGLFREETSIASFWESLEIGTLVPPFKPSEPTWMRDLQQGKSKLRSIESIGFDL